MHFVKILNISFEGFPYRISKIFRRSLKILKCTKLFYTKFSIHPKRKIVKSFEYMFYKFLFIGVPSLLYKVFEFTI